MKKALLILAIVATLTTGCADDKVNPDKNDHARGCVNIGGTIKEHAQYGGKYSTRTYWCVRPDGQITDIWFQK